MIDLVLRRRTPSYVDARHGRTWVLRRRKTVCEVLRRRRPVLRQRTATPETWYNVWWCIFVKKCNFRTFTKYSLETTHSLVLNVVVIVSSHFILFWYVWVIISIWINQQNISDNKNQLSISNQTVSEKTLLPWMCEIWKMLIIAKSVCEIKTDHQTDNQFLFPTIVLIKATKLDHPKLTFW